ncbi:MAG: type II toxin-antitoxin system HicB family antitoxin [Prevotellaceae bacterium]|jgi:predicted RNase H-like HicB family nuclease|nr:type II toxin-antitoxin system HicB family antitoxin [Prevotellaceae bacterium]
MVERINVIVEWTDKNFGAASAQVNGCVAVGDSIEEVKQLYAEALEMHFAGLKEDGDAVPAQYELLYILTAQALLKSLNGKTTLKALHRATEINENLLSHYLTGRKKARETQRQKIVEGLHKIGKELISII